MLSNLASGRRDIIIKFVVVVMFFCSADCVVGSCLSYGHACWGAHGKRNGNLDLLKESSEFPRNSKLVLSKLIQGPIDYRYLRDSDLDVAVKHTSDPLFGTEDVEALNGQGQWHKNQDILSEDQVFDENFLTGVASNRIRFPKVLDKRSTKQN